MADRTAAGTPWQEPGRDRNHATSNVARSSEGVLPATELLLAAAAPFINAIADAVAERLGRSRFLTAAQITSEYGVKARAIRTAGERKELASIHKGHARYFERSAVEAWLAATPQRPANDTPLNVGDAVTRSLAAAGLARGGR